MAENDFDPVAEIKAHRKAIDSVQKVPDTDWPMDGLFAYYDIEFRQALQESGVTSFDQWLDQRRQSGKSVNILDLFGGAYFITDPSKYEHAVGVRVEDIDKSLIQMHLDSLSRDPRERTKENLRILDRLQSAENRRVLAADIYDPTTFNVALPQVMEGFTSFDLIVCRPEAAFNELQTGISRLRASSEENPDRVPPIGSRLFLGLLSKAYAYLSSDSGELFTQIPQMRKLSDQDLDRFVKSLEANDGISVSLLGRPIGDERPYLHLIKSPNAPEKLEI